MDLVSILHLVSVQSSFFISFNPYADVECVDSINDEGKERAIYHNIKEIQAISIKNEYHLSLSRKRQKVYPTVTHISFPIFP